MRTKLSDITVTDRQRSDLGDLDALCESMKEFGQLQPILITHSNRLICGGRRLAAATKLGWEDIEVCHLDDPEVNEDELQEMELEENVRRKDLTWQERVFAIAKIHELKAQKNVDWGYRQTGELVGRGASNVHNYVLLAKLLKHNEKARNAHTVGAAWTIILKEKEDEALKQLATTQPGLKARDKTTEPPTPSVEELEPQIVTASETVEVSIDLDNIVYHGSWEDLFQEPVDHVISDPPYAIDMEMLAQENQKIVGIDDVALEHQVGENLQMLNQFIKRAGQLVRKFMVLWCDPMWFRWLVDLGTEHGFMVQRWPLVWIKTTPCKNSAANYNWTKTFEFAVVMRKQKVVLRKPQPQGHLIVPATKPDGAHPFWKPQALWRWIIEATTLPGEVVLDPFAGQGSIVKALVEARCTPRLFEKNEHHIPRLLDNTLEAYRHYLHGNA